MAFDHYIPASYLGRFSRDKNPVRRERGLWAIDKRENLLLQRTAGTLCGERDFYRLSSKNEQTGLVDSQWTGYENRLNPALDSLIAGDLDAGEWLETLVTFVAALFVRGGDFEVRFNERFAGLGPGLERYTTRDNTNMMRLMELQRLYASVIGARWTVLETTGTYSQITNDIGYTPYVNAHRAEAGIAVPVGLRHILLITAARKRVIAHAEEGRWVPNIDRGTLDDAMHAGFLDSLAKAAQRYIIGSDEVWLSRYLNSDPNPPPIPEPAMLGFLNSEMAREYEMVYMNCLSAFAKPPSSPTAEIGVDYDKNMPERAEEPPQDEIAPADDAEHPGSDGTP